MDPVSVKINLLRMDEVPEGIREKLNREDTARAEGQIWIRTGNRVIRCEDTETGEDLAQVLAAGKRNGSGRRNDPWQEILRNGKPPDGKIRDEARCVILFAAAPGQEKSLETETLAALAPMEPGDAVTCAEDGSAALIKRVRDHTEEDVSEFAAAVANTIETEAGIRTVAGIGQVTGRTAGLPESCAQAAEAIRIGSRFRPGECVYPYSRLQAERIISAIPAQDRAELRREMLGAGKQMTPEIMDTARAFLQNDMNLTTAAKQLYIHRNTLIYRLEKIRKETGFDLRRFRDAAAFQMVSQIPEEENDDNLPWKE